MHESSIVLNALRVVEAAAQKNQMTRVVEITLEIGKLKGALPEAMQQIFRIMKGESLFKEARLTICEIPVTLYCEDCGTLSEVPETAPYRCPVCGESHIQIRTGNELRICSFKGQ